MQANPLILTGGHVKCVENDVPSQVDCVPEIIVIDTESNRILP